MRFNSAREKRNVAWLFQVAILAFIVGNSWSAPSDANYKQIEISAYKASALSQFLPTSTLAKAGVKLVSKIQFLSWSSWSTILDQPLISFAKNTSHPISTYEVNVIYVFISALAP
jgi:hypothetical protein